MKKRLPNILFALTFALCSPSCIEGTDIEQLYETSYTPRFEFDEYSEAKATTTTTSASFDLTVNYPDKVKQVFFTIGQDADSVNRRLGRTVSYPIPEDEEAHLIQTSTFEVGGLLPQTKYYCNIYLQDYADQMHDGRIYEITTQSFLLSVKWDDISRKLIFNYGNIGKDSEIGYRIGYEPDMSDAVVRLYNSNSVYALSPTEYLYLFDVREMLPNTNFYVQSMVQEGGHTYYGVIFTCDRYKYSLKASAEPGINQANIILTGNFTYEDANAQNFKIGFYFAEHPITEDNLGDIHYASISVYPTAKMIKNLKSSTTYYVRPFIAKDNRHVLLDEYSFSTRQGFTADVCDIDFHQARLTSKHFYVRFIKVEPGTFTMGATPAQIPLAEPDEYPAHEVTIDYPFYICETEFTDGMGCVVRGWTGEECTLAARFSFSEALELIDKLNWQLNLKGFRLPTEAEWEYAARGGHKADGDWLYAGSNVYEDVVTYSQSTNMNYYYNCGYEVKLKTANALGLYDMSGNAAEWCSDLYNADYYAESPSLNPTGASYGKYHVVRGGDLAPFKPESERRVSKRRYCNDDDYYFTKTPIGFRLVYDPRMDSKMQ